MTTIDVLVIESNKKEAESLVALLKNSFPQVAVKGLASTINDAVNKVDALRPDLVFLNTDLPAKNGIALFERLKETKTDIIFTGINNTNALKSISHPALSYLTSPVSEKMLKQTFSHFSEKSKLHTFTRQFTYTIEAASNNPGKFNKIVIPETKGYSFIKISDILFIEADGNYSLIHLINGGKIISTRTLKHFEQVLPDETFYRSHKSYLINLNLVKKVIRDGGLKVVMEKDIELDVADRNRKEFLEKIMPNKKG